MKLRRKPVGRNMAKARFGRHVAPHQRHPVPWYHPFVLLAAGRELLSSADQQRNRDVRESFPAMAVIDRSEPADDAYWFDFVADTGDGGNATYAVASTVLSDLAIDGEPPLPRGQLLLFGGDLAYPSASPDDYRSRFVEMFEGARHSADKREMVRGRQLTVAALAQNHDWMDSAATFCRYFLRGKAKPQFLGADIPQEQTYFCVRLPGNWWVLALDFALGGDIDRDQYEQFESLVNGPGLKPLRPDGSLQRIGKDDKVILIYPEPYWTRPIGDGADPSWPWRYQRLEGLIGSGRIKMRLAGDLHHYSRWTSANDGTLLICGTGGAFSHPTHTRTTASPIGRQEQQAQDAIPAEPANALWIGHDDEASTPPFVRQVAYPPEATSRRLAWRNIKALLTPSPDLWTGNAAFAIAIGLFYWFNAYLNSAPFIRSFKPDGFAPLDSLAFLPALILWLKAMIYSPFGLLLNVGMVTVCVVLSREARNELSSKDTLFKRWRITVGVGVLHGLLHLLAVFLVAFSMQHLVRCMLGDASGEAWPSVVRGLLVGGLIFIVGGIVGALLFGSYHALMSYRGFLTNNGYSALGIQDFKGFLRMKIDADGRLTAYFIAIDRVPRRWVRNPGPTGMPVWLPDDDQPLSPRVADSFTL